MAGVNPLCYVIYTGNDGSNLFCITSLKAYNACTNGYSILQYIQSKLSTTLFPASGIRNKNYIQMVHSGLDQQCLT